MNRPVASQTRPASRKAGTGDDESSFTGATDRLPNSYIFERLIKPLLSFLGKRYFRARHINFEGLDALPTDRPIIFYANHSGNSLPWDCALLAYELNRHFRARGEVVKSMLANELYDNQFMNLFCTRNFWQHMDAFPARFDVFDRMTDEFRVMHIYPEGIPGVAKGFDRKYRLERFATSFVRMAHKKNALLVPVHIINAEYTNPWCISVPWVNRLSQRLKIPFFPVGIFSMLSLLTPFLFWAAIPCNMTFVMGDAHEVEIDAADDDQEQAIKERTETIRATFQDRLDGLEKEFGRAPIGWGSLLKSLFSNLGRILVILPTGWPSLFWMHYRAAQKKLPVPEANNWLFIRSLVLTPVVWLFFIPIVGWIALYLMYTRPQGWQQARRG